MKPGKQARAIVLTVAVIAAVADALRYAHGKGIVHRDVKATNVLLDRNGAPYLIDFGVAARDGDDIGGGSLIAASPQMLAGEPSTPADDVFALGGLIYELIAGESIARPDLGGLAPGSGRGSGRAARRRSRRAQRAPVPGPR